MSPAGSERTESPEAAQVRVLVPAPCGQKRQLLADYVERVQALAVEAEMLFSAYDRHTEEDLGARWHRVEQARINCDIARLALGNHTTDHHC